MQSSPSGSATSSYVTASKDSSVDRSGTTLAITDQQSPDNLPDIEEVDDHNEDTAPKRSTDVKNVHEASGLDSKENVHESRLFEADSDTLAYARSLDDTIVSEMTNPTVFQNRPTVESPVEEDAGVLQETSGNVDSQKSIGQVSTDTEKSKSVPDPFDATSSIFSSGDPFEALAARSAGPSTSEGASFGDSFFTSVQSEPSVASKTVPNPIFDAPSSDFVEDPPLEVVDMASSDEGEGEKTPRTSAHKKQTTPKSKQETRSVKPVKEPRSPNVGARVKTNEAVDDPPLEVVDMDSSDDEAPKASTVKARKEPGSSLSDRAVVDDSSSSAKGRPSKSAARAAVTSTGVKSSYGTTPSKDGKLQSVSAVAPTSPPKPILTNVKERKKQQGQAKAQEMQAPVSAGMASTYNRSQTDGTVSAGGLPEDHSGYGSVPDSSSSRQMPPAAEAAGRYTSQRARILAKQRRNRGETNVAVTPERPRMNQSVKSVADARFDSEKDQRSGGVTSRVMANGTSSSAPITQRSEVSQGAMIGGKASEIRITDQEEKPPVQSRSNRTYAVERPQSILKKPRRALPTEPYLYTVRRPRVMVLHYLVSLLPLTS